MVHCVDTCAICFTFKYITRKVFYELFFILFFIFHRFEVYIINGIISCKIIISLLNPVD